MDNENNSLNEFLDNFEKEIMEDFNNNTKEDLSAKKHLEKKHTLRSVGEIYPAKFQSVFSNYTYFNLVQSKVFDSVLYTDEHLVVAAPTGSGKTVIFELAIVRLLSNLERENYNGQYKIIYMSPTKALCEERLSDWHLKFGKFGTSCIVATGDSEHIDYAALMKYNVIITTPEKWDSLTRKWKDNRTFVESVKLFMIDEVHLLNEETRGPTLEVVVGRMKTVQETIRQGMQKIRFIAVSATIPNVEDIAEWIGRPGKTAKYFKFGEEMRPVKLNRVVLGYNKSSNTSNPFKFELMLNYKLGGVIRQYSEGKPSLIFCSTRKSTEMTCDILKQNLTYTFDPPKRQRLEEIAVKLTTAKIRDIIIHGFAYHHAGLPYNDRKLLEETFRNGFLPILVTTSTLASGVNLPAHLVIIKSTKQYEGPNVGYVDYSETTILQMIGRAGRPQFDRTATAVIMTLETEKEKYERMIGGIQPVESNLHRHLVEHLNAEIVLNTITDLGVAMSWLSTTFLYVRAQKFPCYYNFSRDMNPSQIDKKLLEMCQININRLAKAKMISIDHVDGINISPTPTGTLMAKYYLAFDTMKSITAVKGTETLDQLLSLISKSAEYCDHCLRVSDKKALNELNKCRTKDTIRFSIPGKITSQDMKIFCLIQAVFGCLTIPNPSLIQESQKIVRVGERISKCLLEYIENQGSEFFIALLNANILAKCFVVGIWENSRYVCKQLNGIGNILASALASAGKFTFEDILQSNPRDIERILRRNVPVGNTIIDTVNKLPKYNLDLCLFDFTPPLMAYITIRLLNGNDLKSKCTVNTQSTMTLIVGDSSNYILHYEKITHYEMIRNPTITRTIDLKLDNLNQTISAHFISENWVGIDASVSLNITENDSNEEQNNQPEENSIKNTVTTKQKFKLQNKSRSTASATTSSHIKQFIDKHFKITKNNKEIKRNISISKHSTLSIPKTHDAVKPMCQKSQDFLVNIHKNVVPKTVTSSPMTITNNTILTNSTVSKDDVQNSSKVNSFVNYINNTPNNMNATQEILTTPKVNNNNFNVSSTTILGNILNNATASTASQINISQFTLTPRKKLSEGTAAENIEKIDKSQKKHLSWRSPIILPTPENLRSPNLVTSTQQSVDKSEKENINKTSTTSIAKGKFTSPYFKTYLDNYGSSSRKCSQPTLEELEEYLKTEKDSTISSTCQSESSITELNKYISDENGDSQEKSDDESKEKEHIFRENEERFNEKIMMNSKLNMDDSNYPLYEFNKRPKFNNNEHSDNSSDQSNQGSQKMLRSKQMNIFEEENFDFNVEDDWKFKNENIQLSDMRPPLSQSNLGFNDIQNSQNFGNNNNFNTQSSYFINTSMQNTNNNISNNPVDIYGIPTTKHYIPYSGQNNSFIYPNYMETQDQFYHITPAHSAASSHVKTESIENSLIPQKQIASKYFIKPGVAKLSHFENQDKNLINRQNKQNIYSDGIFYPEPNRFTDAYGDKNVKYICNDPNNDIERYKNYSTYLQNPFEQPIYHSSRFRQVQPRENYQTREQPLMGYERNYSEFYPVVPSSLNPLHFEQHQKMEMPSLNFKNVPQHPEATPIGFYANVSNHNFTGFRRNNPNFHDHGYSEMQRSSQINYSAYGIPTENTRVNEKIPQPHHCNHVPHIRIKSNESSDIIDFNRDAKYNTGDKNFVMQKFLMSQINDNDTPINQHYC